MLSRPSAAVGLVPNNSSASAADPRVFPQQSTVTSPGSGGVVLLDKQQQQHGLGRRRHREVQPCSVEALWPDKIVAKYHRNSANPPTLPPLKLHRLRSQRPAALHVINYYIPGEGRSSRCRKRAPRKPHFVARNPHTLSSNASLTASLPDQGSEAAESSKGGGISLPAWWTSAEKPANAKVVVSTSLSGVFPKTFLHDGIPMPIRREEEGKKSSPWQPAVETEEKGRLHTGVVRSQDRLPTTEHPVLRTPHSLAPQKPQDTRQRDAEALGTHHFDDSETAHCKAAECTKGLQSVSKTGLINLVKVSSPPSNYRAQAEAGAYRAGGEEGEKPDDSVMFPRKSAVVCNDAAHSDGGTNIDACPRPSTKKSDTTRLDSGLVSSCSTVPSEHLCSEMRMPPTEYGQSVRGVAAKPVRRPKEKGTFRAPASPVVLPGVSRKWPREHSPLRVAESTGRNSGAVAARAPSKGSASVRTPSVPGLALSHSASYSHKKPVETLQSNHLPVEFPRSTSLFESPVATESRRCSTSEQRYDPPSARHSTSGSTPPPPPVCSKKVLSHDGSPTALLTVTVVSSADVTTDVPQMERVRHITTTPTPQLHGLDPIAGHGRGETPKRDRLSRVARSLSRGRRLRMPSYYDSSSQGESWSRPSTPEDNRDGACALDVLQSFWRSASTRPRGKENFAKGKCHGSPAKSPSFDFKCDSKLQQPGESPCVASTPPYTPSGRRDCTSPQFVRPCVFWKKPAKHRSSNAAQAGAKLGNCQRKALRVKTGLARKAADASNHEREGSLGLKLRCGSHHYALSEATTAGCSSSASFSSQGCPAENALKKKLRRRRSAGDSHSLLSSRSSGRETKSKSNVFLDSGMPAVISDETYGMCTKPNDPALREQVDLRENTQCRWELCQPAKCVVDQNELEIVRVAIRGASSPVTDSASSAPLQVAFDAKGF